MSSPLATRRKARQLVVPQAPAVAHDLQAAKPEWLELAAELSQAVDATDDEQAIEAWLALAASASSNTLRAYSRECRRLLAWLIWKHGRKPQLLPRLTVPLAVEFLAWLQSPADIVIPGNVLAAAGLPGAHQPVQHGLSQRSLAMAVGVLSSLYDTLRNLRAPWGAYTPVNPFARLRKAVANKAVFRHDGTFDQPSGPHQEQPEREHRPGPRPRRKETVLDRLRASEIAAAAPGQGQAQQPVALSPRGMAISEPMWAHVMHTLQLMKEDETVRAEVSLQAWWCVRLLYHTVLRRSEAVAAKMSDVRLQDGIYRLLVTGKGNKTAEVLLSDVCMRDLQAYRVSLGMEAFPQPSDTSPLIASTYPAARRRQEHISDDTLYRRVRAVFEATVLRLKTQGFPETELLELNWASTHWVRHTGITHMLDAGVSMRTVSEHARHTSIVTTTLYDHQGERRRHEEITAAAEQLNTKAETVIDAGVDTGASQSDGGSDARDDEAPSARPHQAGLSRAAVIWPKAPA